MDITDIIRTGHIFRWQIVRTHRRQSIAEHMYQVAMFAEVLARGIYPEWDDDRRNKLVWACLVHDIPEINTGDIPTPAKEDFPEFDDIDNKFWNGRTGKPKRISNESHMILKIADILEAASFLSVEGLGPRSENICKSITKRVEDLFDYARKEYPDGAWGYGWDMIRTAITKLQKGDY